MPKHYSIILRTVAAITLVAFTCTQTVLACEGRAASTNLRQIRTAEQSDGAAASHLRSRQWLEKNAPAGAAGVAQAEAAGKGIPPIALTLKDGIWRQYELTARQHKVINQAWESLRKENSREIDSSEPPYNEMREVLAPSQQRLPIHRTTVWRNILREKIEFFAQKDKVEFPQDFRLVMYFKTYRNKQDMVRRLNLLIPVEELWVFSTLCEHYPEAFREWLMQETHPIDKFLFAYQALTYPSPEQVEEAISLLRHRGVKKKKKALQMMKCWFEQHIIPDCLVRQAEPLVEGLSKSLLLRLSKRFPLSMAYDEVKRRACSVFLSLLNHEVFDKAVAKQMPHLIKDTYKRPYIYEEIDDEDRESARNVLSHIAEIERFQSVLAKQVPMLVGVLTVQESQDMLQEDRVAKFLIYLAQLKSPVLGPALAIQVPVLLSSCLLKAGNEKYAFLVNNIFSVWMLFAKECPYLFEALVEQVPLAVVLLFNPQESISNIGRNLLADMARQEDFQERLIAHLPLMLVISGGTYTAHALLEKFIQYYAYREALFLLVPQLGLYEEINYRGGGHRMETYVDWKLKSKVPSLPELLKNQRFLEALSTQLSTFEPLLKHPSLIVRQSVDRLIYTLAEHKRLQGICQSFLVRLADSRPVDSGFPLDVPWSAFQTIGQLWPRIISSREYKELSLGAKAALRLRLFQQTASTKEPEKLKKVAGSWVTHFARLETLDKALGLPAIGTELHLSLKTDEEQWALVSLAHELSSGVGRHSLVPYKRVAVNQIDLRLLPAWPSVFCRLLQFMLEAPASWKLTTVGAHYTLGLDLGESLVDLALALFYGDSEYAWIPQPRGESDAGFPGIYTYRGASINPQTGSDMAIIQSNLHLRPLAIGRRLSLTSERWLKLREDLFWRDLELVAWFGSAASRQSPVFQDFLEKWENWLFEVGGTALLESVKIARRTDRELGQGLNDRLDQASQELFAALYSVEPKTMAAQGMSALTEAAKQQAQVFRQRLQALIEETRDLIFTERIPLSNSRDSLFAYRKAESLEELDEAYRQAVSALVQDIFDFKTGPEQQTKLIELLKAINPQRAAAIKRAIKKVMDGSGDSQGAAIGAAGGAAILTWLDMPGYGEGRASAVAEGIAGGALPDREAVKAELLKAINAAARNLASEACQLLKPKKSITVLKILNKAASFYGMEQKVFREKVNLLGLRPKVKKIRDVAVRKLNHLRMRRRKVLKVLISAGGNTRKAKDIMKITESRLKHLVAELGLKSERRQIKQKADELLDAIKFAGTANLKAAGRRRDYRKAAHKITLSKQRVYILVDRYGIRQEVEDILAERLRISDALYKNQGNVTASAEELDISTQEMYEMLEEYGLTVKVNDIRDVCKRIINAVTASGGNLSKAARLMHCQRTALEEWINRYGLRERLAGIREEARLILAEVQEANGNLHEAARLHNNKDPGRFYDLIKRYGLKKAVKKIRENYERCKKSRIYYALICCRGNMMAAQRLLEDISWSAFRRMVNSDKQLYGLREKKRYRIRQKPPSPLRYAARWQIKGKLLMWVAERKSAGEPYNRLALRRDDQMLFNQVDLHNLVYLLPYKSEIATSAGAGGETRANDAAQWSEGTTPGADDDGLWRRDRETVKAVLTIKIAKCGYVLTEDEKESLADLAYSGKTAGDLAVAGDCSVMLYRVFEDPKLFEGIIQELWPILIQRLLAVVEHPRVLAGARRDFLEQNAGRNPTRHQLIQMSLFNFTDRTESKQSNLEMMCEQFRIVSRIMRRGLAAMVVDNRQKEREEWVTRLQGWGFRPVLEAQTAQEAQEVITEALQQGLSIEKLALIINNTGDESLMIDGMKAHIETMEPDVPYEHLIELLESI